MVETAISEQDHTLQKLCKSAKSMVMCKEYHMCYEMLCNSMSRYPDSPHPHNLMGILYEKEGCHAEAMKHFRAALALDPTYSPASQNLHTYGTFYSAGRCAFDEEDCVEGNEVPVTGFIARRFL